MCKIISGDMALRAAHQNLKELLHVLGNGSIEKLVDLPGVGEATGIKLLAKRAEVAGQGRAFRITDVMEVEGIGATKLANVTKEAMTKDVIKFATQYIKLFGDKVCLTDMRLHGYWHTAPYLYMQNLISYWYTVTGFNSLFVCTAY